jgi:hypothetical protein
MTPPDEQGEFTLSVLEKSVEQDRPAAMRPVNIDHNFERRSFVGSQRRG